MAATSIDVNVTLRGGLFGKNIPRAVEESLAGEVLAKVEERTRRQGKGIGAQRNTISHDRDGLALRISSTLRFPRSRGSAWQRKNMAIIRSMAPRVMRKAAERIAREMG